MSAAARPWWEDELAGCVFADARLGERLRRIVGRMDGALGASLPFACQDWAGTKAAYRFFSNARVSEAQILAGHFQATRERVQASEGPILVLQDTTEFSFQRERAAAVGITKRVNSGRDMCGRPFRSKRNLQERCSAWSGADMCSASGAARSMPRARMGVRGSGPDQGRVLKVRCCTLVFPTPSLDWSAIPFL